MNHSFSIQTVAIVRSVAKLGKGAGKLPSADETSSSSADLELVTWLVVAKSAS
jgi:hypothetical protein